MVLLLPVAATTGYAPAYGTTAIAAAITNSFIDMVMDESVDVAYDAVSGLICIRRQHQVTAHAVYSEPVCPDDIAEITYAALHAPSPALRVLGRPVALYLHTTHPVVGPLPDGVIHELLDLTTWRIGE